MATDAIEPIEPIGRRTPIAAGAAPARKPESQEQDKRVQELRQRDSAVRRHEQAHLAAAGQYAIGAPSYGYVTGPDNQRYAVSGEVRLDISAIPDDPEGTIRKMEQVKRAALAPSDPSGQDYAVASQASSMQAEAYRAKLRQANGDRDSQGADSPLSGKNSSEDQPTSRFDRTL